MNKAVILLLSLSYSVIVFAQHTPIAITGFNHDVIADGTGNSSLATTTKEMDAITPSNYVLCSQEFATANGFTPAGTYGLPNNGSFTASGRSYLLQPYSNNNALYLFTSESGTIQLVTPSNYSNISIAGIGTEGAATLSIVFNFSDGTTLNPGNQIYPDWFNGTTNVVLQGFGRAKRINGPFTAADYAAAPTNPRFYSMEFVLPCSKTLTSITFTNVSAATVTQSNRAFIFAVSGVELPAPDAPIVAGAGATICPGAATTLIVSNIVGGATYTWYTQSTGGSSIFTGSSFTTPALSATTTYYVQATGSCATSVRTPVTINITQPPIVPVVNTPSICAGNTATLNVQSPQAGVSYNWYGSCGSSSLQTGNSFTTPVLNASTTYYIVGSNSCSLTSTCSPVTVNVSPNIPLPIVNSSTICPNTSATLTVQNVAPGISYTWFLSSSGGAAIFTGTTFSTPSLNVPTTYYVQANGACTPTTRSSVAVNIIPAPAAPIVNGTSVCSGTTAALSVQTPVAGITYNWYSSCGGAVIATGTSFTTPVLISATTFYVRAKDNCNSLSSCVAVTVNINPVIPSPIVNGLNICPGSTATLSVQNTVTGVIYNWYATASGGSPIATGTSFTTPVLSAATTYYTDAQHPCASAIRTAVTVNIISPIVTPVVNNVNACPGSGTATLTVQNAVSGTTYKWYTTATGGSVIFTGTSLSIVVPLTSVTYYVEADNSCTISARVAATVNVVVVTTPVINNVTICAGNATTLTIQNSVPLEIYNWFNVATGGTAIATGTSFTSPVLNATITYYVQAMNSSTCSLNPRTAVTVTVIQQLATPVVTTAVTASSITYSWLTIANASSYEVSLTNGVTWTSPGSGATGTTHTISNLNPNQTVCIKIRAVRTPACAISNAADGCGTTVSEEIFIPNTFSPNGDGKNDLFKVYGFYIQTLHIQVFNQWGEKLFETTDKNKGWDGTSKGKVQPVGVYVYTAEISLTNGRIINKTGALNLVR